MESRQTGTGEDEAGDYPLLSLIEELARRIDGLERMTTNLADELLLGNQRSHRMRSQCAIAFLLLLSCGLLAGAWVKNTVNPPARSRIPARTTIARISRSPVAGRTLWSCRSRARRARTSRPGQTIRDEEQAGGSTTRIGEDQAPCHGPFSPSSPLAFPSFASALVGHFGRDSPRNPVVVDG